MTERKVSSERVSEERLRDLKERAGLKYMPTQMTYEARKAANSLPSETNEHFFARNWEDKPHRVVFDLCEEIERLSELLALRSSVKTVVVKNLEWRDPYPDEKPGDLYVSASQGLVYHVRKAGRWNVTVSYWYSGEPRQVGSFDTLEQAKAAAQAGYESRIMSALEAGHE